MRLTLLALTIFIFQFISAQEFRNSSFEIWGLSHLCEPIGSPQSWITWGDGIYPMKEVKTDVCPTNIPSKAADGLVYASGKSESSTRGDGYYMNLTGFAIEADYTISFDYSGSDARAGSADVQWHLFIDGEDVAQTPVFSSSKNTWSTFSHTFYSDFSSTAYTIGFKLFRADTAAGAGNAGIDNFQLSNTTGIETHSKFEALNLSPNPCSNYCKIGFEDNATLAKILIFNIDGRLIFEDEILNEKEYLIDASEMENGVYLVQLELDGRPSELSKIMVFH